MNLSASKRADITQWTFLGPCCLCLTLALPLLIKSSFVLFLIVTAFGLPMCWRYGLSGFVLSMFLLGAVLLYALFRRPVYEFGWEASISTSIALGLLITALTGEDDDIEEPLKSVIEPSKSSTEELENIKNSFNAIKEQFSRIQEELSVEKELHETCQECLDELNQEHNQCTFDIQKLKEHILVLGQEKKLLEKTLEALQLENNKIQQQPKAEPQPSNLHLENDLKEIQSQLSKALEDNKELDRDLRRTRGFHMQLRAQFDEKCAELEKVRFKLFHTEEQTFLLQKEKEADVLERSPEDSFLRGVILQNESLLEQMENENEQLTDLVSLLLHTKPRKARAPTKRTRSKE